MVASHSISVIAIVFSICLLISSSLILLDYRVKHRKCHMHHDKFRAKHTGSHHLACGGDQIVFVSGTLLVISAFIQGIGAIPAWFQYWKVWGVFQFLLLLASMVGLSLPFALEDLEGFGGPEDMKILILYGFAGIEFLFAFLTLFILFYVRFQ